MSGWYVVKFTEEEDIIEVVPSNWILENKKDCLWPPYTRGNLLSAIKSKETPNKTWSTHKINMMTEKLYSKFVIATAKATKAKFTSDISSGAETILEKRKRPLKRPSLSTSSSSDESDNNNNLPDFPDVPTKRLRESSPIATGTKPISFLQNDIRNQQFQKTPIQASSSSSSTSKYIMNNHFELDGNTTPPSTTPMSVTPTLKQSSIDEEWKQQGIRQLLVINNRLKEQNRLFDHIINHIEKTEINTTVTNTNNTSTILKSFPVTDDSKIVEFDEMLDDENNFNSLVNAMARAGGDNPNEIIRRIMTRILSNEVAVLYSWHGHKGKKKFCNLKLASIIQEAVKKNKNSRSITEKEIEIIAAKLLSKSLDRMKKRN